MTERTDDLTDQVPEKLPAPHKSLEAGGPIAAMIPRTGAELKQMAVALAGSGDMIPLAFRGNPAMISAAIMRGLEIGLAPMQSLSNIAVINGRACIWGDALPALMQKNGHHIDVVVEGEGDDMVAIATLIRGDTGREYVRTFSVDDAKRAGLWQTEAVVTRHKKGGGGTYQKDNDSPWYRYPKRMLSARARAWAVRDGAADAMMGLQVAEEMQDVPMRDVTPKADQETGFARLAERAREKAQAAVEERARVRENPPDEIDGETIEAEAVEEAETIDGISPEELIEAETTGRDMAMEGAERDANPFTEEGPERDAWFIGWDAVMADEGDDE